MTDYRGKYFEGASAGNPVAVSTQKGDKKTAFGSDRNNLYKSDDGVITLMTSSSHTHYLFGEPIVIYSAWS